MWKKVAMTGREGPRAIRAAVHPHPHVVELGIPLSHAVDRQVSELADEKYS